MKPRPRVFTFGQFQIIELTQLPEDINKIAVVDNAPPTNNQLFVKVKHRRKSILSQKKNKTRSSMPWPKRTVRNSTSSMTPDSN
jgi:hypothetical protein